MQAMTLLLLVVAIIICLSLGQVLLAAILFLTLVAFLLFFALAKTASFSKKTAKSLGKGVWTDVEKAKGQNPKGIAEFGKMFSEAGAKTGEMAWAKEKETWRSVDLAGRIGTASKNLLEALGRLFK